MADDIQARREKREAKEREAKAREASAIRPQFIEYVDPDGAAHVLISGYISDMHVATNGVEAKLLIQSCSGLAIQIEDLTLDQANSIIAHLKFMLSNERLGLGRSFPVAQAIALAKQRFPKSLIETAQ